ncbi:MAG TPA: hypothetical protein VGR06_12975 [Actinophytocola sp.]|uniref:hypothetical protein n=1 Tax=Actinophytocola sp. TaxID=1872138 RepID=UPI002E0A7DBD|nr:hypothetical protein [Actinophytocola sp.]
MTKPTRKPKIIDLGEVRSALAIVSKRTGVRVDLDSDDRLTVAGRPVRLPARNDPLPGEPPWRLEGEREELLGTEGALPTVPRADVREKLLWRMLQDAMPDNGTGRALDAELLNGLEGSLVPVLRDPNAAQIIGKALNARFFSRTRDARVLLPMHTDLVHAFRHSKTSMGSGKSAPAGYRLFSGVLLPFLLWNGQSPDKALIQRLFDLLNDDSALNRLDILFLDRARDIGGSGRATANADHLVSRYRTQLDDDFAAGAFCQPALSQFADDLRTVLDSKLSRTDAVEWVTLLVSLHVTVLFYRLALVRGLQLDHVIAAAGDLSPPAEQPVGCCSAGLLGCPLAGSIRFRLGTGAFQPVSLRDPCHTSYSELDGMRLLALPATLVTVNLATRIWHALGGPEPQQRDLAGLAGALRVDSDLRSQFNAGCAAAAVLHHASHRPSADAHELWDAAAPEPGAHALRQDVLLMRGKDLRHQSRDIVNQLLAADPVGRLLGRNGPYTFYEIDEAMLVLLVRIVCARRTLPFGDFLLGLRKYGLAPQHELEKDRLADSLERLGLLIRYSDAGEAAYVHDTH